MSLRLDKVVVEQFKKIQKAELPLADLNILVGSNSSGKSSIIQAVHLASCVLRQAPRIDRQKTSTVSVEELDYLPSNFYKLLCHKREWGNTKGTPSSKVKFTFLDSDGKNATADCQIRSARNAGISVRGSVPLSLVNVLRRRGKFFSAYIPGIAGIPNREEKRTQKVVQKSCSFGDSNVVLRNVLLLLKERDEKYIKGIEQLVSELVGDLKIHIGHDQTEDLFIDCNVEFDSVTRPLELMGTGHLQLIQIFSYLFLFNPGVLLIDEPDTHLHPDVQERLPVLLSKIAREIGTKIILTTHSPFLLRGAPPSTNVYWMEDGGVAAYNREQAELTLGWGAFGKRILILSEDSNTSFLRKLVLQWPEIDRQVAFVPGYGYSNLVSPRQALELKRALGDKFEIVVHRDRDSLLDDEVDKVRDKYSENGIHLWVTDDSDLEACFCSPDAVSSLISRPIEEAEALISDVIAQHSATIKDQFSSQRKAHNQELYPEGGSPANEDCWEALQARVLKGAKGKFLFKQLKNKIGATEFNEEKALNHEFEFVLAPSLRDLCLSIVEG